MILHVRDRPQPGGAGGRKICAAMFFTVELSLFRTVRRGTVDVAVGFSSVPGRRSAIWVNLSILC
jgi:hypothetical protein